MDICFSVVLFIFVVLLIAANNRYLMTVVDDDPEWANNHARDGNLVVYKGASTPYKLIVLSYGETGEPGYEGQEHFMAHEYLPTEFGLLYENQRWTKGRLISFTSDVDSSWAGYGWLHRLTT